MIKKFILEFLNTLSQPLGDNPWPANLTNKTFKTQFHRRCNFLLGFQVSRKVNDSILKKRWPRNDTDVEDDSYQTPSLSYNKEMDQLMVANTITNGVDTEDILRFDDEKESEMPKTTYPKDTMTDSEEEHKAT